MFIGAHSPAQSDQMKKWSESRAAAPKSQCPVKHRDKRPDVVTLRLAYFRPKMIVKAFRGRFELWRVDLRLVCRYDV